MEPVVGSVAEYNARATREAWHSLCDPRLAFNHPDLAKLSELWRSEAGEDGVPHRRVMSPRLLKSFLRDIPIYERLPGADDGTLAVDTVLRFLGREDTNQMTFLTGEFFSAPLVADDGEKSLVLAA